MTKKNLFLTMIVISIFYGCSDKENDPAIITEGEPTYMSVSITFPKAGPETRATSDPNATVNEVTIKSVDIFIYGNAGQFQTHHSMKINLFNPAPDDQYVSTEQIKTTTGPKTVYAGINLPQSMVTALINQPMGQLANTARVFTLSDFSDLQTTGLPMFNVTGNSKNFVKDPADPANHVEIDVKRLVAKITVDVSASLDKTGVPGELGPLMVGVSNFNTKIFLEQGAATDYKDPNWTDAEFTSADFEDTPVADFVTAHDLSMLPSPTVDNYNNLYALENTSENKRKKELTRVTVRATFIPDEITVSDGAGGYEQQVNTETVVKTFYTVTPAVGEVTRYFYDQAVATQFANGSSPLTYQDGYCYWDMFLNKGSNTNEWDVLRNDYYKCTITKIVAPGRHTPDLPDPEGPPSTDTNITVEINIQHWQPVPADYILEP